MSMGRLAIRLLRRADTFIKLRKRAGEEVILQVLRGPDRLTMPLKTQRMGFRK